MKKKSLSIILTLMIVLSLLCTTGCNDSTVNNEDDKTIIAVSIVPQQTFVEAVCGDLAKVITMVPPGNSPANYEPTAEMMEKFTDAALYFTVGVPTEEANILPDAGDVPVISLADEVAAVYEDKTFDSGGRDPHIWLSPKRVVVMIEIIAREMSKIDPDNTETYNKNADTYIGQLNALDNQIKEALVNIQSKKFIVYHPAFGYLASDYGLTMYALEAEGSEATAKQLQDMIDLAKEENIKVIFYQEEIDSSQSEAFAEEIGGETIQLAPLAADYIANLKKMAVIMAEAMQ